MQRRDHTSKNVVRIPLSLETAAFIVVKQAPAGKAINSYEKVPEAFIRYCLLKARHN
jgi:hypothetical protein